MQAGQLANMRNRQLLAPQANEICKSPGNSCMPVKPANPLDPWAADRATDASQLDAQPDRVAQHGQVPDRPPTGLMHLVTRTAAA